MKRSEMLALMWKFIQSVEDDYNKYMDESDCDELLSLIEKAGMLPPLCPRGFDIDGLASKRPPSHRWEPEEIDPKKITNPRGR